MPHYCQFGLNENPLHQNNRMLRMSKTYSDQNFHKQTVLTDDVFTYVSFYFCSHHKAMKFANPQNTQKYGNPNQFGYEFYWNQAKIFYDAAKKLPIETAPVAAYYCMLNAAKSYLSYTSKTADLFVDQFGLHGLNEDHTDSGNDLSTISIKHKENGVFPLFAKNLDADFLAKWPAATSRSLKSLLYNLPFVHRAFTMTYTTRSKKVDELFLPLNAGDSPKYYKGNDGKAYLVVELERQFFAANASSIPAATLASIGQDYKQCGNTGFKIISAIGARYNSNSISGELKELNNSMRKTLAYIRGAKRLWYVKRVASTNSDILNVSNLTINMAAMHRVSEIARYKPEQLNRLMQSNENWLLHEFISLSLDQFIDELAAQITQQDIMCTGQKE